MLAEELDQLLTSLGLPADPQLPLAQLSGGQQTRLALQWLFSHPVDLLLLDEPSNHLDAEGRQWLIEQIQQLARCPAAGQSRSGLCQCLWHQ